jgi:hypothetical protein
MRAVTLKQGRPLRSPFAVYTAVIFVAIPVAAVLVTVGRNGFRLDHTIAVAPRPSLDALYPVSRNGLFVTRDSVVSGSSVNLAGIAPGGAAGRLVTILSRPAGTATYEVYGTTTSVAADPLAANPLPAGSWTYVVTPGPSTEFVARSGGTSVGPVLVKVAPRLALARVPGNRLSITVVEEGGEIAPTVVSLQRYSGRWTTVARATARPVGPRAVEAAVTVSPSLPRGVSPLRAFVSSADAGKGYLAGKSPVLTYRR